MDHHRYSTALSKPPPETWSHHGVESAARVAASCRSGAAQAFGEFRVGHAQGRLLDGQDTALGLGQGGYGFFGQLNLAIGAPNGARTLTVASDGASQRLRSTISKGTCNLAGLRLSCAIGTIDPFEEVTVDVTAIGNGRNLKDEVTIGGDTQLSTIFPGSTFSPLNKGTVYGAEVQFILE